MRCLYNIISDVYFCFNILIKSQETFEFNKTILKVFSCKEVLNIYQNVAPSLLSLYELFHIAFD